VWKCDGIRPYSFPLSCPSFPHAVPIRDRLVWQCPGLSLHARARPPAIAIWPGAAARYRLALPRSVPGTIRSDITFESNSSHHTYMAQVAAALPSLAILTLEDSFEIGLTHCPLLFRCESLGPAVSRPAGPAAERCAVRGEQVPRHRRAAPHGQGAHGRQGGGEGGPDRDRDTSLSSPLSSKFDEGVITTTT
jgi:hypothetical protein